MYDEDPSAELEAEVYERMERGWAADEELADLAAAGNAVSRAREAGRCPAPERPEGYSGGPRAPQQEGLKIGQLRCVDDGRMGCGAVFGSDEDWYAAMDEAMFG